MNKKRILALGFFDGIHAGHGQLMKACRRLADETGSAAGVVTFGSHPDELVFGKSPALINTPRDRERILREQFSMDEIITLPFDRQMMTMAWQDFFRLLTEQYGAAGLVCGHDFRFGDRGQGTAQLLQQACREKGMPCVVVPAQRIDGVVVSSTYIRGLLEAGEMERANRFLGHPHLLSGTVVHGRQLGRTIGIPTANLLLPAQLQAPRFGVYACLACFDGKKHMAVTNVGTRPTVDGEGITVEPWILDFDGDLYGREIVLEFYSFIRPEVKFPSLEALQTEIRKNAEEVREYFGKT